MSWLYQPLLLGGYMDNIVVEDGTIVAGANSFVTVAEFITYTNNRGYDVASTTDDPGVFLIKAVDYLRRKEYLLKGTRVDQDQCFMYPREDVWLYGFELTADEITDGTLQYPIPTELKEAQMQVGMYLYDSVDLLPITGGELKRKKIGPLEREYFQGQNQPYLGQLDTLLAPLCKSIGVLSVGRV